MFFELDGTLIDPKTGITKEIQYALNAFDIKAEQDELLRFIGPPLRPAFMEFYHMTAAQAEHAVTTYREYYSVTGLYECALYPGIPAMLEELRAMGKRLVVATSKPTVFARPILEHFDCARYFEHICGCELDGTRDTKSEVVAFALESAGVSPGEVVMVGDREHDVLGAGEEGVPCAGVTYGYGGRGEPLARGAPHLVDSGATTRDLLVPP